MESNLLVLAQCPYSTLLLFGRAASSIPLFPEVVAQKEFD